MAKTELGEHTTDADCVVDPETDCCRECGVHHSDPCPACGGRGFHLESCPELRMVEEDEILSADEAAQNIIDAGGF